MEERLTTHVMKGFVRAQFSNSRTTSFGNDIIEKFISWLNTKARPRRDMVMPIAAAHVARDKPQVSVEDRMLVLVIREHAAKRMTSQGLLP